jgi:hypothetical protein
MRGLMLSRIHLERSHVQEQEARRKVEAAPMPAPTAAAAEVVAAEEGRRGIGRQVRWSVGGKREEGEQGRASFRAQWCLPLLSVFLLEMILCV